MSTNLLFPDNDTFPCTSTPVIVFHDFDVHTTHSGILTNVSTCTDFTSQTPTLTGTPRPWSFRSITLKTLPTSTTAPIPPHFLVNHSSSVPFWKTWETFSQLTFTPLCISLFLVLHVYSSYITCPPFSAIS